MRDQSYGCHWRLARPKIWVRDRLDNTIRLARLRRSRDDANRLLESFRASPLRS